MATTEYPKIETLFDRDAETFRVNTNKLRLPEFALPSRWHLTEKIDGTNIRVEIDTTAARLGSAEGVVIKGRSDNAQMQPNVLAALAPMFACVECIGMAFDADNHVVLYGEAYGARVQKSGGNYRSDVSFRLFDVRVGDWWLNWHDVEDVAGKLNIHTVPSLASVSTMEEAVAFTRNLKSTVAFLERGDDQVAAEGVVARTDPLLFTRRGQRVMWKLKARDLPE